MQLIIIIFTILAFKITKNTHLSIIVSIQVFSSELFKSLREHYRGGYGRFMEQKLIPVVGDVTSDRLGMKEKTREELSKRVDIIVNTAATTSF